MSHSNDNPGAFPFVGTYTAAPGMSLRDWFAGQALAGFHIPYLEDASVYAGYARCAYGLADAMLAQRKK